MWLITPLGFFSIVQKQGDSSAGTLTIRARAKGDLEALREAYLPSLGPIIANAGSDYRYRAQALRTDVARAMGEITQDIAYDNFKNEVQMRQGSTRAKIYHKVWGALYGIAEPEKQQSSHPANLPPARLKPAFGGVLLDQQNRVLLCKPRNEFDGYAWTFPKGRPQSGETPEQTALREVLEETGYDAHIILRFAGRYAGGTTTTEYFLMTPKGNSQAFGPEIEAVRWVSMGEAEKLIGQTANDKGRKRDLKVLRDVSAYLQHIGQSQSRQTVETQKGVDACCMVNGKLSNAEICEQMLEDGKVDPEVTAQMVAKAKEMGFSDEDALRYWG